MDQDTFGGKTNEDQFGTIKKMPLVDSPKVLSPSPIDKFTNTVLSVYPTTTTSTIKTLYDTLYSIDDSGNWKNLFSKLTDL